MALSRTPIHDRRGKVWIRRIDPRDKDDEGWLNPGVTRRPRQVRPPLGVPRKGKATPQNNPDYRKVRNSLESRIKQHSESPCDGSGKQPNLHNGEKESRKPGSVNPRKS